jgi:hypothetical protein
MSEYIPLALILCSTQTRVDTMLSILSHILSAPIWMHGKERRTFRTPCISEHGSGRLRWSVISLLSVGRTTWHDGMLPLSLSFCLLSLDGRSVLIHKLLRPAIRSSCLHRHQWDDSINIFTRIKSISPKACNLNSVKLIEKNDAQFQIAVQDLHSKHNSCNWSRFRSRRLPEWALAWDSRLFMRSEIMRNWKVIQKAIVMRQKSS